MSNLLKQTKSTKKFNAATEVDLFQISDLEGDEDYQDIIHTKSIYRNDSFKNLQKIQKKRTFNE